MTFANYQFKPKLWALVITISLVLIFVELGKWQLSRADEKNSRQAQLDALSREPVVSIPGSLIKLEDFLYRQVEVTGRYHPEYTIYLNNKTYMGNAGYHVLTPLQIGASNLHVIVNRGWVKTGYDRSILPDIPTPTNEITIMGTVVSPELRTFELSKHVVSGAVWENFNLDRFKQMTDLEVQPVMIQQKSALEDGLVRDWISPDSGASKNIGYAIQWFSLAATSIIIFLVLNVKRSNQKIE